MKLSEKQKLDIQDCIYNVINSLRRDLDLPSSQDFALAQSINKITDRVIETLEGKK